MIFKKDYGQLIKKSLNNLVTKTEITNTTVGGIARSILEVINLNIAEYYDILDINTTMGFVSTAEGYFLDLIGDLFNIARLDASYASAAVSDSAQKFYVTTGTLDDRLPSDIIPQGTIISTSDDSIRFTVTEDIAFDIAATEVYVPITSETSGSNYNVGVNALIKHNLSPVDLYTTNIKVIVGGSNLENDDNYRYRIINASLSAEKANETAVRLAALSAPGVANVVIKPYARGIGTFDVIVVPVEGIATDSLVANVQAAINLVRAFGITGTAIKPTIVPVDIEVKLVFVNTTTDAEKTDIRDRVKAAIEKYIVNIPIGGDFILNELRQQIMDVSTRIKDHIITCYYFREEPVFMGNVSIYWDEMFYPNPNSAEAVRVL